MFLSQAASVSRWQMLEVNSVSLSCSFLNHSSTVSSAGLCLLCWLSSACRDAPRPPGEAAGFADARSCGMYDTAWAHFCWLRSDAPEYPAWNDSFVVVLFVAFHKFWSVAILRPDRWLKHFHDYSRQFLKSSFALSLKILKCLTWKETFLKMQCPDSMLYSQRSFIWFLLLCTDW